MRIRISTVFVSVSLAMPVNAGVVEFDPPVVHVGTGQPAVFEVTVAGAGLATFDGVTLIMASRTPGLAMSFEYAESFAAAPTLQPVPRPQPFRVWPSDLFAGGNRLVPSTDPAAWRAPLLVGTLTIDTTFWPEGIVDIFVDAAGERDLVGSPLSGVAAGVAFEPLYGSARVYYGMPEPATLVLLGLMGGAVFTGHWRTSSQWHPRA
jgi:hypothetical protein